MEITRINITHTSLDFDIVHEATDYHYELRERLAAIKAVQLLNLCGYDTTASQLSFDGWEATDKNDDNITVSYRFSIRPRNRSVLAHLEAWDGESTFTIHGCIYHHYVPDLECKFTLTKPELLQFLRDQQRGATCYINDVAHIRLSPNAGDPPEPVIGLAFPAGVTIPGLPPPPDSPVCNSQTVFYSLYVASPVEWISGLRQSQQTGTTGHYMDELLEYLDSHPEY